MGRKNKKDLIIGRYLALIYRWEFARRSAEYIRDYDKFKKVNDSFLRLINYFEESKKRKIRKNLKDFLILKKTLQKKILELIIAKYGFCEDYTKDFIKLINESVERLLNVGFHKLNIKEQDCIIFLKRYDNIEDCQHYIKSHRLRFDKYEKYLRIYDLKRISISYGQIVHKLIPDLKKRNYPNLLKEVKRGHKRAKQLVNGGWRHIK